MDLALHSQLEMPFKGFLDLNSQIELDVGVPVDMIEMEMAQESLKEEIFASGILIKGTLALQKQLERKN